MASCLSVGRQAEKLVSVYEATWAASMFIPPDDRPAQLKYLSELVAASVALQTAITDLMGECY